MGLGDVGKWIFDHGKQTVGRAIDDAAQLAGDVVDAFGLPDLAHTIDHFGDVVADRLGATPDEKNLGETEDPHELIHGAPNLIGDVVNKLGVFADGFGETGDALHSIDTGSWHGDGFDAFAKVYTPHQQQWSVAHQATSDAKTALDTYNRTLIWAQDQAAQAIREYDAAVKNLRAEVDSYNQQVDAYNDSDRRGPRPGPVPPSAAITEAFHAARDRLVEARTQRNSAAEHAVTTITAATNSAPPKPSLTDRLADDFVDAGDFTGDMANEFAAGLVDSLAGLVQMSRMLDPYDIHNLTHPAQYMQTVNTTAAGLLSAADNPVNFVQSMVGTGWGDHPGEALGDFVGNLAVGALTGGGGEAAAAAAHVAEDAAENAALDAGRDAADNALTDTTHHLTDNDLPTSDQQPALTTDHTVPADGEHPAPTGDHTPTTTDDADPTDSDNRAGAPPDPDGGDPQVHASPADTSPNHPATPDTSTEHPTTNTPTEHPTTTNTPTEHPATANVPGDHPAPVGATLGGDSAARPSLLHAPGDIPTEPGVPAGRGNRPIEPPVPMDEVSPATSPRSPAEPEAPQPRAGGADPEPTSPAGASSEPRASGAHTSPSATADHAESAQHPHPGLDADHPEPPPSAHDGSEHPATAGQDAESRCIGGDPVDFATGEVVFPETDLELPGVLPLRLSRMHLSTYRAGRGFGRRWASTLDQRVETNADSVVAVGEDAALVRYPHAAVGVRTAPAAGSATRHLTRTERGGYRLDDPKTGLHTYFHRRDDLALPEGVYPMVAVTDRHQNRILFDHNIFGVVTRITHSCGYRVDVASDDAGRVTAYHLAGPTGPIRVRSFGYDPYGRLSDVVNGSGQPFRFDYDINDRLTGWTDRNGYHFTYSYDEHGRCIAQSGADGSMANSFAYVSDPDNPDGSLTAFTDALGHTTYHRVDAAFHITAVTDPAGATSATEYDAARRPLAHVDALGRGTQYRYTTDGDLSGIRRDDGSELTVTYHRPGLPARIRNYDGAQWQYSYTEFGDLAAVTDPTGARTGYEHNQLGARTAVTDRLGVRTRIDPTPAGLPETVTDAHGHTTRYTYDPLGRPETVTDPLGNTTRIAWSVDGKPLHREHPDGGVETWTYDAENNLRSHTDPVGNTTAFTYGAFDKVTSRTDPDGAVTRYRHDAALKLTTVTNPQGLTWTYSYDPCGRLSAETDFDDRTLSYTHDAAGRLAGHTNGAGETILYGYNRLGLLTREAAPDNDTRYEYDLADRLIRAENRDATVELERDPLGRIVAETVNGHRLTTTYDPTGQRLSRTTPTGVTTRRHYNELGHPTQLDYSGRTITSDHDRLGREIRRSYAPGVDLDQTWTPCGRLAQQTLTAGKPALLNLPGLDSAGVATTLLDRRYHYNAADTLTTLTDLAGIRTYTLDPVSRVTTVTAPDRHEVYRYDHAGNLTTTTTVNNDTATHRYSGTRITHAGRSHYRYDTQSRLVQHTRTHLSRKPETWQYHWDSHDRLRSVTTPDGHHWTYTYDPFGRRIGKTHHDTDGTVLDHTRFTWDGNQLTEQTSHSGQTTTWTYTHSGSYTPITQHHHTHTGIDQTAIDEQFYAIITDLVGTPTELLDLDTRTVTGRATITVWGQATWTGTTTPLRFPGQYHDPETGLHYNHHRYYDPHTARYTTTDPLGLLPSPNPSTYVDNPTGWIDPLGLTPCPDRLSASANEPLNGRAGDSAASRAYQKHMNRPNSTLTLLSSGKDRLEMSRSVIDDLLTNPRSAVQEYVHTQFGPVHDVRLPEIGARWSQIGEFIGFLEG